MKNYLLLLLAAQSLIAMDNRQFIRHAETGNIPALEQALRSHADVNQTDPDTEFTALHAALWNYNPEAATLLLRHDASVYKKTRDGKTARHFLAQHLGACYREGMLICKDKPCAVAWPKEFLVRMNGECFICLNQIEEIGHVYDCGHVVHKACVDISGECTICLRPHRDERAASGHGKSDDLKKETKDPFEPGEPLPAIVPVAAAPAPAPVPVVAAAPAPAPNTSLQVFYNGRIRYELQPDGGYWPAAEPLTPTQAAANQGAAEDCRTYNQGNNK